MRVLMLVFLVSWFTLAMPSTPVHTQDSAAEAALASVISDFERILKRADPITAGLDGDRDALRRLPDPSRDTELAKGRELSAIGAKLAQISIRDLSSASALTGHRGGGRAGRVRLRPHRVPERRRLPHARRLPRTYHDHRLA